MSLLAPLALLTGLLAIPILILYMLRLRRTETPVSSTLLWQKLLRDRQANAPWQRLRRNLLLILQLLILAALALALARPFVATPSVVSGSVVVLLDGSASMLATDVQPSRFDAARAEVQSWIGGLSGDDAMTLILVGRTPRVLATAGADPQTLRRALQAAQAEPVTADWSSALALAGGAAQGARNARIVIVSDGGLRQQMDQAALPPLPGDILYVAIGQRDENLALSALATRQGPEGLQLLASVHNYGAAPQAALLSIYVNETLFDARRITPAPGAPLPLTWALPPGSERIRAELSEQEADFLPADDRAWAVHAAGAATQALLLTPGNLFLEQVFTLLPGVTAVRADPAGPLPQAAGEQGFELLVLDGGPLPEPLPPGDLLLINPTTGGDLLTVGQPFSATTAIRLADSPLLQFVEWRGVNVRQARQISAPWAQAVVQAEGGPLLLAGEQGGRRIAVLTFDLRDSDLPLRVAFPVLMANITAWLSPGQVVDFSGSLQPGQPAALSPEAGATALLVDTPSGEQRILTVEEEHALIFEETHQPGIYTVTARRQSGDRLAGRFAVNLFAPQESAIAPAATVQIGRRDISAPQAGDIGRREFWPWLAALALLVLLLEWWVHFRGPRLPRPPRPEAARTWFRRR